MDTIIYCNSNGNRSNSNCHHIKRYTKQSYDSEYEEGSYKVENRADVWGIDDYDLFNLMLSLRSHGWLRDNDSLYRRKILDKYDMNEPFLENYFFVYPGLNIRNTDLNAFVGLGQMKKLDDYVNKRDKNYNLFFNNTKII